MRLKTSTLAAKSIVITANDPAFVTAIPAEESTATDDASCITRRVAAFTSTIGLGPTLVFELALGYLIPVGR